MKKTKTKVKQFKKQIGNYKTERNTWQLNGPNKQFLKRTLFKTYKLNEKGLYEPYNHQ